MARRTWVRTPATLAVALAIGSAPLGAQYRLDGGPARALKWTATHPGVTHTVLVVPVAPQQGERVEFTSTIRNTGSEPIEIEVTEDLSVGGDLRLDAPPPQPRDEIRRLAPGESFTQRAAGIVRSPAGEYTVSIPGPFAPLVGRLRVRTR